MCLVRLIPFNLVLYEQAVYKYSFESQNKMYMG